LTSLNLSNDLALTDLDCSNNQLSSLNIINNTALLDLLCYANQTVEGCESNTYLSLYAFVTAEPTPQLYVNSNYII
jgi:Leucine-rich repeat (LRR) protein